MYVYELFGEIGLGSFTVLSKQRTLIQLGNHLFDGNTVKQAIGSLEGDHVCIIGNN